MKKALVIIDLQKGFINGLTRKLLSRIRNFIMRHKKDYGLVIFTRFINHPKSNFVRIFNYKRFMRKEENELVDEVGEFTNGKNVFNKDTYGNFVNDEVLGVLKKYKIGEVHLAGIDTENCVLTFARDAFDRGYKVKVFKDLCASHSSPKLHRAALEIIKYNIGNVK